tara:strand:+ start:757 stop:1641 length:885 start_codon:yes stop_codon:yes gene_type:complete
MKKFLVKSYLKILAKFSNGKGYAQKFPILKKFVNTIESSLKSDFVEFFGGKMYLDSNDSMGLSIRGVYGPASTRVVLENVKIGNAVVDLGANIGYYSLILAKLVGKEGKVFSFEPVPKNFSKLEKNIKLNNYSNVIAENMAISNFNGKTELFVSQKTIGGSTLYEPKQIKSHQNFLPISVSTMTLDNYLKSKTHIENIDFLKIDIEGSEVNALKGATNILKNPNLKILIEISPLHLEDANSSSHELLNLLLSYNFEFYFANDHDDKIEFITMDEILKKLDSIRPYSINVFCKKP